MYTFRHAYEINCKTFAPQKCNAITERKSKNHIANVNPRSHKENSPKNSPTTNSILTSRYKDKESNTTFCKTSRPFGPVLLEDTKNQMYDEQAKLLPFPTYSSWVCEYNIPTAISLARYAPPHNIYSITLFAVLPPPSGSSACCFALLLASMNMIFGGQQTQPNNE